MTTGFRNSAGVDFDSLFDPYVQGASPGNTGLRIGGVDLAGRYAPLAYGSKGPDVGYRSGGVDVSNLWAAIGTAEYVSDGGVGTFQAQNNGNTGPRTATATLTYKRDGTATWTTVPGGTGGGGGTWAVGPLNPGDAYDIRYTQMSGAVTGADGVWRQVNASRVASCTATVTSPGAASQTGSVKIDIRRHSDGVIVVTKTITITASVNWIV